MKTRKLYKEFKELILVLMGFVLICMVNVAADVATTQATTLTPTNLILDYDSTYIDSNLRPGDSGVLQVVIKNTGLQPAEDVRVYIPGTADVSVNKRWDVGRIEPLGSKAVSTTISISKNAYIGLHTLQIRITYDGYDAEGDRENDQLTVWELPLRVYGAANFQIEAEKAIFYKGVTDKLVLKGTTKDGARDVSASLSSSCASIIGSAKSYIGDLGKGGDFKLEYLIQPNQPGICSLSLLMEYSDVSGNAMTETLSVGIDVQRYDVDFKIIDVVYKSLTPGNTTELTIKLSNMGSAVADDVSVTLDLTDPFTAIKSSERYIGDIKSHETKDIEFKILVDATADIKAYEIPLSIEYFDSSGTKREITKDIGIQVTGKPEIKVTLEEADFFTSGSKGKVTINVINKGFADVKFLNLKLLSTEQYDVLSSSETYIGNLDSDDTDSEEFEIQIKQVPPGRIPLKIEVSYKEKNSNVDHVDSMDVWLNVLSKEEYAQKKPTNGIVSLLITAIGALIGIIILILVIWFVYKLLTSLTGYLDRRLFKRRG